jgi:hypothetical protein
MTQHSKKSFFGRILSISPWYFLVLALICGALSLRGLYSNNRRMLELRTAVFKADETGVGVEQSLQALQAYVTAHMNTDLATGKNPVHPPIQLKNTYERLIQAKTEEANKANAAQYAEAQNSCRTGGSSVQAGRSELACITNYMQTKHNVSAPTIPDALYKFDFVSPTWSPDLAGWAILATIMNGLLFVASLLTRFLFK